MKKIMLVFLALISTVILFASSDTELVNAVENQDDDKVLSLLKKGANPDAVNKAGEPVLFIAVNTLNPKIFKILVDNGADLYIKDADGRDLTKTIIFKQADIQLSALETEDSDLKNKENKIKEIQSITEKAKEKKLAENPNEALIYSTGLCDMDGIKKALKNKANINYQDKTGNTALHTVAQKSAVISKINGGDDPAKIIGYLLKQGIDPKIKNKAGQTVLHFAVKLQGKKALKLLLSKGVGINDPDNTGITPLMASVYNYDSDIAEFLLKSGADPNLKDKSGKTALDWALKLQKEYTPPKDDPFDNTDLKKVNPYNDVVEILKKAMKK